MQNIADLKNSGADYNPRKISKAELERLKKALDDFGDLGGIIFNRRTGRLVGGHQRISVLPVDAVIEKTELSDRTRTGTVAHGYIIIEGEQYAYREVDWDETREKAANIAANAHGGDWDNDKLADLLKELSDIPEFDFGLTGFSPMEFEDLFAFGTLDPSPMKKAFEGNRGGSDISSAESQPGTPVNEKYPLTVILDHDEWQVWESAKERAGIRNDKAMILKLIEGGDEQC